MGNANSGKPREGIIKLDGTTIIDGKIDKSKFFDFLQMDLADYSDLEMTTEEALKFKNAVIRYSYGTTAALPLYCRGTTCLNRACPLHELGRYPLSKPCLVEVRMISTITKAYVEELGIDPNNMSEMVLVNKLVENNILEYRANLGLSGALDEEAGTLLKSTVMESDNGVHQETTAIHPLLEVKEKILNSNIKILESFVATRREKYKKNAALKEKDDTDSAKQLSELRKKTAAVTQRVEQIAQEKNIIDADWSTSDL